MADLTNMTIPRHVALILDGNGWYDSEHMERVYTYYKKLVDTKNMLKKAVTGAEKMNLNKEIKKIIQNLNESNVI